MTEEKKSIKELVVERLAKSGKDSLERLLDALTETEMVKRHDTLLKAVKLIELAEGQAKAAQRPDAQTFNLDGSVAGSHFTQSGLKNLKACQERRDKLQAAFDKALDLGDFGELNKLVGQGEGKAPSAEEVRAGN